MSSTKISVLTVVVCLNIIITLVGIGMAAGFIYVPLANYKNELTTFIPNVEETTRDMRKFVAEATPILDSLKDFICKYSPDDCPR